MNKEQLQGLLNQRYNVKNWEKIYGSIFPNVTLFSSPKEIPVTESWVKSFRQRGLVRLDGKQDVAIFEVVLQDGISVQSKRVGLRNLVAKLIDEYQNHGVLAVFDNGSPEYRFTFAAKETKVTREGIEKSETDSKRYTYILGETETCKTAAEQFIKLAEKGTGISLTDLKDAFSVEKLSKQFFNEYKEQYNQFVGYLSSQPRILKSVFGDDEKKMRDFVKLLLGRLVFLQFVQKKKWLGVPAKNKDWHSGDVRFLVNAFNGFANKDKFYSDYLEELFFGCLNNPNRKNELFELSGSKVPFLNGGLFENDNAKTKNLNFPATYFTGLFEFFGKYNFTIDENDPTEKEVGIDPEMLGSIFENLLEDNKDKGAFYTPKEIVHYMCQESLIEYLNTKINEKQDEVISETLRVFITKRKTDEQILKLISPIAIALREVKICDPAIGSGAFPMGMLMEIFHAVFELYNANPKIVSKEWNMNGWQPNVVKSNIIQNSIYGVDIEKGAVDIARLRFWLSLIVDEEEPKALPNLDYKIVVGNSLISKLGDDIINIDWVVKANFTEAKKLQQEIQNNLNKLFNTQKLFFNFNGKKENLKAEIRNLKIDVLISQLQLDKRKYSGNTAKDGSLFGMSSKEKAADQERKQRLAGFDKTIRELQRLKSNPELPLNFFDWKLDFPEVLNELMNPNKGFDIVIGNPPYGANIDKDAIIYQSKYNAVAKKYLDIYKCFFQKGFELLIHNGVVTLITPNTFVSQPRYADLRKYLTSEYILKINNLGMNVFETAVVPTCIFFGKHTDGFESFILIDSSSNSTFQSLINSENSTLITIDNINSSKDLSFLNIENLYGKTFDDVFNIKDAGIQYHRSGIGLKNKGGNDLYERLFSSEKKKFKNSTPTIYGKKINSYYIDYIFDEYFNLDYKAVLNSNESVSFGREAFETIPKIIWRQTASKTIATIDYKGIWFRNTIQCCWLKNEYSRLSLEFCLGLINSKFIGHSYNKIVSEAGRVFPQVKIGQVKKLPFVFPNKILEAYISVRVKNLLKSNETIPDIDTINQIDIAIYHLYELSYDDAISIDPELSLSKKEFENISFE
jgi:adenine-specific DNA-methyltransferase